MAIRKRGMERKMQKTKKQIESFALESSFSSEEELHYKRIINFQPFLFSMHMVRGEGLHKQNNHDCDENSFAFA